MQPANFKARREILWICSISALALAPLLFLSLRSRFEPRAALSPAVPIPVPPVVNGPTLDRLVVGERGVMSSEANLSPDGRWIARMEMAESERGLGTAPGAAPPTVDELVIRASANGQEMFRALACGDFVGWIPGSVSFVAQNGLDINVFSPTTRKIGAPPPAEPWKATLLSFPPGSERVSRVDSGGGPTNLWLERGAIGFSPDFKFAVKATWNQGDVWWQVADLATGKIAPRVHAGVWLNYDANIGGSSSDIAISVAPASSASGAWPRVALLQTTRPRHSLRATPTPQPTPLPTPTPSAAQSEFLTRAKGEEAAIQSLIESVSGIDGADPVVTDEAEIARIEAEVKRRFRALDRERAQLFPLSSQNSAAQTGQGAPPKLEDAKPFQIECFDLRARKKLWVTTVRAKTWTPQIKFSPDGAALVAWGTARLFKAEKFRGILSLDDTGIDIFASSTGQIRAQFRLYEADFSHPKPGQAVFYWKTASNRAFSSIVAFGDVRFVGQKDKISDNPTGRVPVLRFFDLTTAREVGHLDLDVRGFDHNFQYGIRSFSSDDNGNFWLFGDYDYQFSSRSQLGREFSKPLPQPTPTPRAS